MPKILIFDYDPAITYLPSTYLLNPKVHAIKIGSFNVSKKAVENLIANDLISYEAAAEAMSIIASNNSMSKESSDEVKAVTMTTDQKTIITKKALQNYFEDTKFNAMVELVKEDDTLLATEFNNIENARARIKAEIVAKEEHNFNSLLNQLKTTGGTNGEVIDKLLQTQVSLDDANV